MSRHITLTSAVCRISGMGVVVCADAVSAAFVAMQHTPHPGRASP